MFDILGEKTPRFCDGISRRNFLRVGALGMGGIALPDILRAESAAKSGKSHKAVIMIYMAGAPPHQDLIDPKPDAPSEFRGDIGSIPTSIPGIHIGEMLPRMAKIMDKWSGIRSIVGAPNSSHDSFMCYTGRQGSSLDSRGQPAGGWPSIGTVISKLQGPHTDGIPPFFGLAPNAGHPPYGSSGHPGFLGASHGPFKPNGAGQDDMVLGEISPARLGGRRSLLHAFDNFRRSMDGIPDIETMDAFTHQAFDVLTSSKLADALNLDAEPPKTRERYGKGDPKNFGDGAPRNLEHFLLARRLVEAGARCVTLNFGRWDFHDNNTKGMQAHAPLFDQGLSALIEDLHDRGLADEVSVVAWGEFGRTPKLNGNAGRDHWPNVSCAFLAGGGMKTGQMIGATDKHAAEPTERPVHMAEVHATLYHNLGIDPHATLEDLTGRPQYIVDGHHPIPELI